MNLPTPTQNRRQAQLLRYTLFVAAAAAVAMPVVSQVLRAQNPPPPGGTPPVAVAPAATRPAAPAGDHVIVSIGDTGPGIPEALRKRVFEPFFTTKPVGEGTGLGLDISYRIVVNGHGGDIVVKSQPGDTRFLVKLPIAEPPSR